MLCERCHGRRAVVHVVNVVNGRKSEAYLCRECANQSKIMKDSENLLNRFSFHMSPLMSLGHALEEDFVKEPMRFLQDPFGWESMQAEQVQPGVFKDSGGFARLKDHIHKSLKKTGNPSERGDSEEQYQNKENEELQKLQMQLETCIQDEKYEEAAKLRDRIAALKKKM